MAALSDSLRELQYDIMMIMVTTGIAGPSIGVIHNGQVAHKQHFGWHNHACSLKPDSNTRYGIGPMTQGMIAAVVGNLVERRILFDRSA
jgi:CubicO group peptidase (beta-lactamase class C family)